MEPPVVQTQVGLQRGTAFYISSHYLLTAAHNLDSLPTASKSQESFARVTISANGREATGEALLVRFHAEPYLDCALLYDAKGLDREVQLRLAGVTKRSNQVVVARGFVGDSVETRSAFLEGQRELPGTTYFQPLMREVSIKPGMSGAPIVTENDGFLIGHVVKRDRENFNEAWMVPLENISKLPVISDHLQLLSAGEVPIRRAGLAHFLDHYVWQLNAVNGPWPLLLRTARKAFLCLMLTCSKVYVPAVSYFEFKQCREIVDAFNFLFDEGRILLVGDGEDLCHFAEMRLSEYPKHSAQFEAYKKLGCDLGERPGFIGVHPSTTRELLNAWPKAVERHVQHAHEFVTRRLAPDWRDRIASIEDWLDGSALIASNVEKRLFQAEDASTHRFLLDSINRVFLDNFALSLDAEFLSELPYFAKGGPTIERLAVDYGPIARNLSKNGTFERWGESPTAKLFREIDLR